MPPAATASGAGTLAFDAVASVAFTDLEPATVTSTLGTVTVDIDPLGAIAGPRTLAVGPVAVASLMTAAALAPLAAQGSPEYLGAAIALAVLGFNLLGDGLRDHYDPRLEDRR